MEARGGELEPVLRCRHHRGAFLPPFQLLGRTSRSNHGCCGDDPGELAWLCICNFLVAAFLCEDREWCRSVTPPALGLVQYRTQLTQATIGMGIKAVSTPILASEIAFTQWRGSSTLMWQLWSVFKPNVPYSRRGLHRDGNYRLTFACRNTN